MDQDLRTCLIIVCCFLMQQQEDEEMLVPQSDLPAENNHEGESKSICATSLNVQMVQF